MRHEPAASSDAASQCRAASPPESWPPGGLIRMAGVPPRLLPCPHVLAEETGDGGPLLAEVVGEGGDIGEQVALTDHSPVDHTPCSKAEASMTRSVSYPGKGAQKGLIPNGPAKPSATTFPSAAMASGPGRASRRSARQRLHPR